MYIFRIFLNWIALFENSKWWPCVVLEQWIRGHVAGKALAHPSLKQPTAALYEQPIALDISNFETSSVFSKVRSVIFQNSSGVWRLNKEQVMYSWMHVPETPYVVIGASTSTSHSVVWPPPSTSANLAYHRLDLANPSQYRLCRNLRQLSSLGRVLTRIYCHKY